MKICRFTLFLLALVATIEANPRLKNSTQVSSIPTPNLWSSSVAIFESKFYSKLRRQTKGNIFYSPLSIHMQFLQLLHATSENSTSRKELSTMLGLPGLGSNETLKANLKFLQNIGQIRNSSSKLNIANKIFVDKDFEIKPEFLRLVKEYFLTSIGQENFLNRKLTAEKINNFAMNQTNGLIKDVINEEDLAGAVLVLVNAIYFSGQWKHIFDEGTFNATFHSSAGTKEVSFMSLMAGIKTLKIQEMNLEMIELPYKQGELSMVIILPDNLTDAESKIEKLGGLTKLLENFNSKGNVSYLEVIMPKFELAHEIEKLKEIFNGLGVESIFIKGAASLTHLSDRQPYVSHVGHKAMIKINELGSEAAAVTTSGISLKSLGPPIFRVDRPFLLTIVDKQNKVPLFVGRVVDLKNP